MSCRKVISFACVAHVALLESLVAGLPDSALRFCLLLKVHTLYCICILPAISPLSVGMVPEPQSKVEEDPESQPDGHG